MPHSRLLQKLVRVDLNLLTVLHALHEQGSTQAAADEIGRTQSAVSHALSRLREMFNDPLFVRSGPKLTPTQLAQDIKQPLARLLHDASGLIESGQSFVATSSDRQILIGAEDICLPLVTKLTHEIRREAPNIRVRLENTRHGMTRLLKGELDLTFSFYKDKVPAGLEMQPVGNVSWATFAASDHPISQTPTAQEWASYGHVQVATGPDAHSPVSIAATLAKVTREVVVQTNSFQQALHMVAESDLLFSTMGHLAAKPAARLGLKRVEIPFPIAPIPMALVSRAPRFDPLSQWLVQRALASIGQVS